MNYEFWIILMNYELSYWIMNYYIALESATSPGGGAFKNVMLQAHFDLRNPQKRGPEQGFCATRPPWRWEQRSKIY